MQSGPLPPHERTWRHPSELAAQERAVVLAEPTLRSARVMAITSGTIGLLAVGLLMVTITPGRAESPVAISASTTPVDGAPDGPIGLAPAGTDRVGFHSAIDTALATPIGDGRFALVTRTALLDTDRMIIDVRLPSGRTTVGSIVTASEHAVVVALAATEPGHAVTGHRPADDEIVTVLTEPPVSVAYDRIGTVDAAEGTAVLDEGGMLIGLCSRRRGSDRMHLIEIMSELSDATTVARPASR